MPVSGTIFAVSSGGASVEASGGASGFGHGAITLLRLSGADAGMLVLSLCGVIPPPRRASLRRLRGQDGALLDRAVVTWMPAPASYTGEDMAELSLHGGQAVLDAVTGALLRLGARPAAPGDFTRRAFLAGRMDLLEAEAVGDLVAAETQSQRLAALRQLEGAASRTLAAWASRLRLALAVQEASIDFPEEVLAESGDPGRSADLVALACELEEHAAAASRIERRREGLVFAIVGPPNAGKSSLMNVLARRDVAIVAPTPGTTRDALEACVVMAGVRVTLVDTAGLRETDDPVEAEGVRRALAKAAGADLVLRLDEAGTAWPGEAGTAGEAPETLRVASKIDLAPAPPPGVAPGTIGISTRTMVGLAELEERLAAFVHRLAPAADGAGFWRARHAAALLDARSAILRALAVPAAELRAEELRLAMGALGRVTGEVDSEAVLDTIFSSFCIGK